MENLHQVHFFLIVYCFGFLFGQLGGGYLFGLYLGFVTDSLGSTLGATAAFLVGRTVSIPFPLEEKKPVHIGGGKPGV